MPSSKTWTQSNGYSNGRRSNKFNVHAACHCGKICNWCMQIHVRFLQELATIHIFCQLQQISFWPEEIAASLTHVCAQRAWFLFNPGCIFDVVALEKIRTYFSGIHSQIFLNMFTLYKGSFWIKNKINSAWLIPKWTASLFLIWAVFIFLMAKGRAGWVASREAIRILFVRGFPSGQVNSTWELPPTSRQDKVD